MTIYETYCIHFERFHLKGHKSLDNLKELFLGWEIVHNERELDDITVCFNERKHQLDIAIWYGIA